MHDRRLEWAGGDWNTRDEVMRLFDAACVNALEQNYVAYATEGLAEFNPAALIAAFREAMLPKTA